MGKVVKGAQVAREAYVLKTPSIVVPEVALPSNGHVPEPFDYDEPQPTVVVAAPEPTIDWEAVRAQAAQLLDDASADAERLIRDAQARALELVTDASAHAVEIEEEARTSGFEQGRGDGRAAAQAEMDEMLSTMRGLIEMARIERHKIIESAEPEIVRLSTAIAERILHQQIKVDPETVLEMTRAAITRLVHRETVTVRVNPADLETMRENRERMMSLNDIEHFRIIEDQRVDRGGVVMETEAGTIDAKISTQLREVRRLLAVEDKISVAPSPKAPLLNPPAQAS